MEGSTEDTTAGESSTADATKPSATEHPLRADRVAAAFAAEGIVAGVLRPSPSDEIETFMPLVRGSDLVIIDWHLNADRGDRTVRVLRDLASSDGDVKSLSLRSSIPGRRTSRSSQVASSMKSTVARSETP